jgi:hypothetical protein
MTITVAIRPEVQDELARQAAALGIEVGAYAASLLEEAVHLPVSPEPDAARAEVKDIVELFAPLRGLNLDFSRNPSTGRPIGL